MGKSTQPELREIDFGVLNERIGYQLGRAYLRSHSLYLQHMAKFGVASGHFSFLTLAINNPDLSQTELANATGLDRSSVTLIANQLVKMGFIERIEGPNLRTKRISVTEAGREKWHALNQGVIEHEAKICQKLSEKQRQDLFKLLALVAQ